MIQLTVLIITYNEERNIARCIESVRGIADEVLVVDSSSQDATVAIAERLGAKVLTQSFLGYGEQKNWGSERASHDWILSLDADEELTPALRASIAQVKNNPEHFVYHFARVTNYCGQWIRHCGWYPDRQTRLYNRTKGAWVEKKVHEYWQLREPQANGLLRGDLLHYSFTSVNQHIAKIHKYTDLSAAEAARTGKRVSVAKLVLSPVWHFVQEYLIRLGFLDGYYGFVICRLSAYSAFLKCLKTIEQTRKN